MVNSTKLSPEDIRKGQEKIKEEIYARAKEGSPVKVCGLGIDFH